MKFCNEMIVLQLNDNPPFSVTEKSSVLVNRGFPKVTSALMGNCNWPSIICHFVNLSSYFAQIAKQSNPLWLLILVIQPIGSDSNLDFVFQK